MQAAHRGVAKLITLAVGMFLFSLYVMPPLYNLFCEVTGLNGKTGDKYTAVNSSIDKSRWVTVQFVASNNENMPWYFAPAIQSIRVHPGEEQEIRYAARNTTGSTMVGQAIPSLIPFKATDYFHKTECFCFNQQHLLAGESAELPLKFIVDRDIPKHITTITLAYTIFDVTERFANSGGWKSAELVQW